MHFDFAAIMLSVLLISGVIWVFDLLGAGRKRWALFKKVESEQREPSDNEEELLKEPIIVDYARSIFSVILIVFIVRSFIFEPFRIPSGSMMPTLVNGDFILVNKFDYGIRIPVIDKKLIDLGTPNRGDVVVFRYPKEPHIDYIKRVVGLPGDEIHYEDKRLYVNGEQVKLDAEGIYPGWSDSNEMKGARVFKESLGEIEHGILLDGRQRSQLDTFKVPVGEYFVMGDNRDHSNDSRFWGFVPDENLVGRAFFIWMNFSSFGRVGSSIQ
ncbi:MAG: signal peptidase I [Gammaproteobacteria bacterium]|nr:signal peptidase I [Gammaproteobacteria bacterium]